jgi:hypothetical protein
MDAFLKWRHVGERQTALETAGAAQPLLAPEAKRLAEQ